MIKQLCPPNEGASPILLTGRGRGLVYRAILGAERVRSTP